MRTVYNILVALFVLVGVSGCSVMSDEMPPVYEKSTLVRVGDVAPDFTVPMVDGSSVTLSHLQGRTVLLVFFTTQSAESRTQLAVLGSAVQGFDSEKFSLLTISTSEQAADVQKFVNEKNYTFPVGVDADGSIFNLYATEYTPRCFVIDPLGRIVALSAEYNNSEFELLCQVIASLL